MTKINELFFYGAVNRTLRKVFPVVAPYQGFISCFGTPWGFILASKGNGSARADGGRRRRPHRVPDEPETLGYWNGAAHLHSFNLPKFLTRALAKNDRIITDEESPHRFLSSRWCRAADPPSSSLPLRPGARSSSPA
jgi:spermidine synthase